MPAKAGTGGSAKEVATTTGAGVPRGEATGGTNAKTVAAVTSEDGRAWQLASGLGIEP